MGGLLVWGFRGLTTHDKNHTCSTVSLLLGPVVACDAITILQNMMQGLEFARICKSNTVNNYLVI
jgi:hypothetical protein